jgi:hypothetical protein
MTIPASATSVCNHAAEKKALIAATHMPFSGSGRIVSDGGKPRRVTAEQAYQD